MVHIIWFLIGILTLPTHLAQFIPFLKRKSPPPFGLYAASLMANIGIALLIGLIEADPLYRFIEFILYLILGIFMYGFGVVFSFFNCCCCFEGFNDQNEIDEELKAGFDHNEAFHEKIAKNRSFPPNILVCGEAYHYETRTRTYTDTDGNLVQETYQVLVVSYRNQYQLKYLSWQEDGNPITLTEDSSIIHGYIYCNFNFDEESRNLINEMRKAACDDASQHDVFVNVYNQFIVPEMHSKICGTTRSNDKTPCVAKWIPTCFGRILIIFLKIIGYSTLVYSCWSSTGLYMKMTLIKNISMKPKNQGGFRCGFMELDIDAIKTTFHSNNQEEQPEIDEAKLQETFTSLYQTNSNVVTGYDPQGGLSITMRPNENGQTIEHDPEENVQRLVEESPVSQEMGKINENKENSDFSLSNSDEEK